MILQALVAYYNKLAARGEISKPGWAKAKISWAIELGDDGMVELAHHVLDHPLLGVKPLSVEDDLLIGAHMLERREVVGVRVIDDSALAGQADLVHILVELVERVILHNDLLRLQGVLAAALTRADILAAIENHAKIAPI